MDLFQSIIFGVVQGFTEFLPISSSGHLFLLEKFWEIGGGRFLEIWLHGASLLAILIYFWKDIWKIIINLFSKKGEDEYLGLKLLLATSCTIPVALWTESYFILKLDTQLVAITLLITGGLIFFAEYFRSKKEKSFSWIIAIFLGLIQGFAVLPGISRSGLTIAFLIFIGVARDKSARYSFLLAIPTIVGALVFSIKDSGLDYFLWQFSSNENLIWSLLICFISSLLAIKWMLALIKRTWGWFALYCFLLGGGILLVV